MSRLSIREAIADAVYDAEGWHTRVDPGHIRTAEFRPGLAQMDVTYFDEWHDDPTRNYVTGAATIDALPVWDAILQKLIEEE